MTVLALIVQEDGVYELWVSILQRRFEEYFGKGNKGLVEIVPTTKLALEEIESRGAGFRIVVVYLTRKKGMFEKAKETKRIHPECRVVIFTGDTVGLANPEGVVIVDKSISPSNLPDAILGEAVSHIVA